MSRALRRPSTSGGGTISRTIRPMAILHFSVVAVMTVVISGIVLRQYGSVVRRSMSATEGETLPAAPPSFMEHRGEPQFVEVGRGTPISVAARAALRREAMARRRVILAYLVSVGASGVVLSVAIMWLNAIEVSVRRLIGIGGATLPVAVPMMAISLGWPFWRSAFLAFVLGLTVALAVVVIPTARHLITHLEFDQTYAMNGLISVQLSVNYLWLPLTLVFITGFRKIRGVAPMALALVSVLGLVPLFGAVAARRLGASTGSDLVVVLAPELSMDLAFFVLAPAAGWGAWKVLQALSNGYMRKSFSDAQLVANAWWLIVVAVMPSSESVTGTAWWVLVLVGLVTFLPFSLLSRVLLRRPAPAAVAASPPTLLLLRLFGHASRSERFFDRVISRWRLQGPVTVIGAPDLVARTLDPADVMQMVTGRLGDSFIMSQQQLDARIAAVDHRPDPDGRFRVNEFWCRDNSWQATVTALMSRCDAVVMDVRGLTEGRQGVIFELEQLGNRLPTSRVVLVVDHTTDRALIARTVAGHGTMRMVHAERNSPPVLRKVFETL